MNNQVELSRGFFQSFYENNLPVGLRPILQILDTRELSGMQAGYRVKLSDGVFSCSACCVANNLRERFINDKLHEHKAIICITKFQTGETIKRSITIADYVVIVLDSPIIGSPQPHVGKAEDYRGISSNQQNNKVLSKKCAVSPTASRSLAQKRQSSGSCGLFGTTEISLICPYMKRWRICGIVSNKEDIKLIQYKRSKGEFCVFNFTVTDEVGNSIRVAAFEDQASRFFPLIDNGQVYYLSGSGSSIQETNQQYNSTGHVYELRLLHDSEVSLCTDSQIEEPKFRVTPVKLSRISGYMGESVDVIAVVGRVSELSQVTARNDHKQLEKREIFLVDESLTGINLTLWGEQAKEFDASKAGQIIAVKGSFLKEFNGGYSLSISSGSIIKFNPDHPATEKLQEWFREERTLSIKSLSSPAADSIETYERDIRLIGVAISHNLGRDFERGVYFNVEAMVTQIKTENATYQGCTADGCRKKVIVVSNRFKCDKCNSFSDSCKNIMLLSVEIADFSGTTWATIFEEKATELLGVSADELVRLKQQDSMLYDAVFDKIRFRIFNTRVRVKHEVFNDERQMKWSILDMKPVPYDKSKCILSATIVKCDKLVVE